MGRFVDQPVDPPEKRTASGQNDPPVDNIRRKIGRRPFKGIANRLDHLGKRIGQRLPDLLGGDGDRLGKTGQEIASLDLGRKLSLPFPVQRNGRTDLDLDPFRRRLSDQEIKIAADLGNDRRIEFISANPNTS